MYTCFTVMGYGKKMDYNLKKEIDLDNIYNKLIKPVLSKFPNIRNIRGDEISSSEIIDKDMFELLLSADLVIADITTLNPNAIYELGVRHALKPYSTIILSLAEDNIPFDFSHNRIFTYDINNLGKSEPSLEKWIKKFLTDFESNNYYVDSPFYYNLSYLSAPKLPQGKFNEIRNKNYENIETINSLINDANKLKEDGKYLETSNIFKKLYDHNTHNNYYLQQQSLFLSKVDGGKSKERLIQAEKIINRLKPLESFDNETTGIYGGIEKRLYNITGNSIYLDNAINAYNRGFIIRKDYYNGENVVAPMMIIYTFFM
ncbi:tetratricopeptide repeat-containing protein [Lactobacillaceae bacterium Melli_B4]